MATFPALDPLASAGTRVDRAQRFLASAYDSVAALFDVHYPLVRSARSAKQGRLTHAEQDLFRAAVVFAAAGLDSTLKELVRQAVPLQVKRSADAREKFRKFTAIFLSDPQGSSAMRLAEVITSDDPRASLVEAYLRQLTGSNL